MPLQFMATAEAYSRMYRAGEAHPESKAAELVGTPVGQIAGMMTAIRPVRDIIFDMVEEYTTTVEKMQSMGD
jgi:NAD(P)H-dependent flavin oxidoreductase YrpB (nitropropane dioxygenase family)